MLKYMTFNEKDFIISKKLVAHINTEFHGKKVADQSKQFDLVLFCFFKFQNACRVVHLLLEHQANPNLLCNGFSGLALSIASGNDLVREQWEYLKISVKKLSGQIFYFTYYGIIL